MENGGDDDRSGQSMSEERTYQKNTSREAIRVSSNRINSGEYNKLSGLTLAAVLNDEKKPSSYPAHRTLFDIIREDRGGKDKKTWKLFKHKLRRRSAGSTWTSSVPVPASDILMQNNNSRLMMRQHSTRQPIAVDSEDPASDPAPSSRAASLSRNSSRMLERVSSHQFERSGVAEPAETDEHPPPVEEEGGGEAQPGRISLMSLLAETGLDESSYMMGEEEEEDEEEEEEEEEEEVVEAGGGGRGEYNCCCVCMVRHKGAAFIPCGHTFCRLCSRELLVQRGNCPLCNNFILEILDIF